MFISRLAPVLAASWPWGPPGAQLADVLFAFGTLLIIVALITWSAMTDQGRTKD